MSGDRTDARMSLGAGAVHNSARAVVDDKSKTWILAVLVALNLVGTVAMFTEYRDAKRETRMQEYYLMELDAKFIAAGLKKPEDSIAKKLEGDRK